MVMNGYNDSPLAWCMRYILSGSYNSVADIENIINSGSDVYSCNSSGVRSLHDTFSFSWRKYVPYAEKLNKATDGSPFYDIDYIELSNGENVKISEQISALYAYVCSVSDNTNVFVNENIQIYLDRYFLLSKKYVFNTQNTNLNNLLFRRSKTLENLNCIGRIPWGNQAMTEKGYSLFNVCSPYVSASLQRTIYNAVDNIKRINSIEALKELRTEIFITQMNRSFNRFTSYNKFTNYRVSLNRHSGELISVPYNELSSLEEVKPLRLFEKIISHIKNRLNGIALSEPDKKLVVRVAIIGHTEQSFSFEKNTSDNRELEDLLRVVMSWYVRENKDSPKLELIVTNFVNNGDIVNSHDCEKRCSPIDKYEINGNIGEVVVKDTDYFANFYFSKKALKKICEEYDITFILDCPWMTVESYELKNRGLLDFYCNSIQNESIDSTQKDNLDSEKRTAMQELDTQFNRITSSDSIKSGEISRLFRDDIIKAIKGYVENISGERRDVYIFTSEKDGVDYSFLASYPLTRKEIYGGKDFTISHFCNKKLSPLPVGDSNVTIQIRLWSVLKYIAVSYAFIPLRRILQEIIGFDISPENYFELLRSVIIKMELHSNINELDIRVCFLKNFNYLKDEIGCDENTFMKITKRIYEKLYFVIHSLYCDGVFSDKDNFGDNVIKTGFEMNLRSAALDVNTLLFIHHYKYRRQNNSTQKIVINWTRNDYPEFIETATESHCFKDKRLYEMMFDVLQETSKLGMGTLHTLYTANDIFNVNNMEKHILQNITDSCRKMNYTNSNIYRNALEALQEI